MLWDVSRIDLAIMLGLSGVTIAPHAFPKTVICERNCHCRHFRTCYLHAYQDNQVGGVHKAPLEESSPRALEQIPQCLTVCHVSLPNHSRQTTATKKRKVYQVYSYTQKPRPSCVDRLHLRIVFSVHPPLDSPVVSAVWTGGCSGCSPPARVASEFYVLDGTGHLINYRLLEVSALGIDLR